MQCIFTDAAGSHKCMMGGSLQAQYLIFLNSVHWHYPFCKHRKFCKNQILTNMNERSNIIRKSYDSKSAYVLTLYIMYVLSWFSYLDLRNIQPVKVYVSLFPLGGLSAT